MKKIMVGMLAIILVIVMLMGCSMQPSLPVDEEKDSSQASTTAQIGTGEAGVQADDGNDAASDEAPVIALTMPSLTDLWWISIQVGVKEKCEEIGAVYMENDAKNDINKQIEAIENYTNQGVDGIIIGCVEPTGVEAAVLAAKDAGIPVISVATPLENDSTNITLSESEMGTACGEMAAEFIKEQYGDKPVEVAILDNPALPTVIERADSMVAVLEKEVPNAKVVARQRAFDVASGLEAGENILQANPDVKIVLGINDGGVLGFSKALVAAGQTGEDVGCFGISTADEFMIEMSDPNSILRGTLDLYPRNIGAMAVTSCIELKAGEELPKVQNNTLVKVWQKDAAAWIEENGLDSEKS